MAALLQLGVQAPADVEGALSQLVRTSSKMSAPPRFRSAWPNGSSAGADVQRRNWAFQLGQLESDYRPAARWIEADRKTAEILVARADEQAVR